MIETGLAVPRFTMEITCMLLTTHLWRHLLLRTPKISKTKCSLIGWWINLDPTMEATMADSKGDDCYMEDAVNTDY
jgi:hypothetical protein